MNYTEEQLKIHGELILKWLASGRTLALEIKLPKEQGWETIEKPNFITCRKYREAPKPLYVNSIGEKFYKEEEDTWYFSKEEDYVFTCKIKHIEAKHYKETEYTSEIFKTKSGAYQAASDYFKKLGQ